MKISITETIKNALVKEFVGKGVVLYDIKRPDGSYWQENVTEGQLSWFDQWKPEDFILIKISKIITGIRFEPMDRDNDMIKFILKDGGSFATNFVTGNSNNELEIVTTLIN